MRKFTPRGKMIQQDEKALLAKEGLKYCNKCKFAKKFENFGSNISAKDGYNGQCIACVTVRNQSEEHKVSKKKHRESEKGKATTKTYNASEKAKAQKRRYDKSEKGKAKKRHKEALRRARKLCLVPPNADLKEIEKLYDESCKEVHVDHIISFKENFGLHCIENLKLMNGSENISKKTTLPDKETVAKLDKIFLEKYGYDRLKHGPFMEDLAKVYKDTKHTSEVK